MKFCQHQDYCGGCQFTKLPYHEELAQKTKILAEMALQLQFRGQIEVLALEGRGDRCRTDLSLLEGHLGFYRSREQSSEHFKEHFRERSLDNVQKYSQALEIFDLQHCEHWSPGLSEGYARLKKIRWPFKKASLRLRVSPSGEIGLWMDLSNLDVKSLLEDPAWVQELLAQFSQVEVGQKFKKLVIEDRPRLREGTPQIWFQTQFDEKPLPLYCFIGSFTQPSLTYNKMICDKVMELAQESRANSILEFGSGIGNLSFPLLSQNRKLIALENSKPALAGFQQTLAALPAPTRQDLEARLRLQVGDFQSAKSLAVGFSQDSFDTVVCNPPRSGLMHFSQRLFETRPENIIYMSCFPESMLLDLAKLRAANYQVQYVGLIDQFPRSKHFESLIWLKLR